MLEIKYCECGCGEEVKNRFVHGHNQRGVSSWNKGIITPIDTRKKISNSLTGIKRSKEFCEEVSKRMSGEGNPFYGKSSPASGTKKTSEQLIKMSEIMSGKNHPNWKGGISDKPYCGAWSDKEYRNDIKDRDGFKCQNSDCWGESERLSIHHIDYNKVNCRPENLIALCNSCNVRANYNRSYWQELYTNMIIEREVV